MRRNRCSRTAKVRAQVAPCTGVVWINHRASSIHKRTNHSLSRVRPTSPSVLPISGAPPLPISSTRSPMEMKVAVLAPVVSYGRPGSARAVNVGPGWAVVFHMVASQGAASEADAALVWPSKSLAIAPTTLPTSNGSF